MATKIKSLSKNELITNFTKYVLENNQIPATVYKFCNEFKIPEIEFYNYFSSIDQLQQAVWTNIFNRSLEVLTNDTTYNEYDAKQKLITLYFTFFENLTLNRSYFTFILNVEKNPIENLSQLKELRHFFKAYISELLKERESNEISTKIKSITFPEGAWIQFLFVLNFWRTDTSKGFEKTDILIEKSLKTTFDIVENQAIDSILDLGKFLWKENNLSSKI